MNDPLADAIEQTISEWVRSSDEVLSEVVNAAVRAHLAAVLDAEEAAWEPARGEVKVGAECAIFNLRAALGVAKETEG